MLTHCELLLRPYKFLKQLGLQGQGAVQERRERFAVFSGRHAAFAPRLQGGVDANMMAMNISSILRLFEFTDRAGVTGGSALPLRENRLLLHGF